MALKGVRVLELAGLAPASFCGMVLTDFGATVVRVDRADMLAGAQFGLDDVLAHSKKSVALNLKMPEGIEAFKKLSAKFDVVIDPFRPGVMEKLTLGPTDLLKLNRKLVYTRISGYGQNGPLSKEAGHDINYTATSGVLHFLGRPNEAPRFPLNLVADFAGGGLMAALGTVMALYERNMSGHGQIVDNSMTRGAAYASSWLFRGLNTFLFCNPPGRNVLDGGSFFYNTYQTKDGRWLSVGSLESKFYSNLLKGLNIDEEELPQTTDFESGSQRLKEAFAQHTLDHWVKVYSNLDACVMPVLIPEEAAECEHSVVQKSFDTLPDGILAPNPEPRLSRTPATRDPSTRIPFHGEHTFEILKTVGYSIESLKDLLKKGAIAVSNDSAKL